MQTDLTPSGSMAGALQQASAAMGESPIAACHVGGDADEQLASYARGACATLCLLLCDENTREAAGDRVHCALGRAGKRISELCYGREPLDATEELAEEVAHHAQGAAFITAVGAGTLADLAKYAGDKLNIPVLLFPTAASMNGYTSGIVALKVRGLKRTQPCRPATGVFADPAVVAGAPQRMTAAGVGDFLSKASSACDWRAAHFLRGEYYSEEAMAFYEGAIERGLAAAPRVGVGDPAAVGVVLEALLLSGLSMLVAGSSSPASGGEHLISHFIDMKSALYGFPHDLHGAQVGVATVHCLRLWRRVLALDPNHVDVDALVEAQPGPDVVAAAVEADWGATVAAEVMSQWRQKALDAPALRAEIDRFLANRDTLQSLLARDLLPPETVEKAISQAGGPTRPEDLTAPGEVYAGALRRARYIRNRFTVLDLAAELGAT